MIICPTKGTNTNTVDGLLGSKLTLVRWPVASGFPVGPVESVFHALARLASKIFKPYF